MLSSIILIAGCSYAISFGSDILLNKVLLFIAIYLCGAYYLINLGLYFIALSYVIVYIGAIAILFLFIIMICSSNENTSQTRFKPSIFLFFICGLWYSGPSSIYTIYQTNYMSLLLDIQNLSIFLFNWPTTIILIGILLTSCLIGI